jgi:succinate-acetate transporter protein
MSMPTNPASVMGDPKIPGLTIFAFLLAMLGVQFVAVPEAASGVVFAVLVASIAETVSGVLAILRGEGYVGAILCMFGIWLFGLFFLELLSGLEIFGSPAGIAWYVLILVIPVAYMSVPAFAQRNIPLVIAFVTIIAALILLGIALLAPSSTAELVSGLCCWAAALSIWYIAFKDVLAVTGLKRPADAAGAHSVAPAEPAMVDPQPPTGAAPLSGGS